MTVIAEMQRMMPAHLNAYAYSTKGAKTMDSLPVTSQWAGDGGAGKAIIASLKSLPSNSEFLHEQTNTLRSLIGLPAVSQESRALPSEHVHGLVPEKTAEAATSGAPVPCTERHVMLDVLRTMMISGKGSNAVNITTLPIDEVKERKISALKSQNRPDKLYIFERTSTSLINVLAPASYPHGVTLVLQNIPNNYTREQLVEQFTKAIGPIFDFVTLPVDPWTQCNAGYCFVGFRNALDSHPFVKRYHQVDSLHCLPGLTNKVCTVSISAVHGTDAIAALNPRGSFMDRFLDRPPVMLDPFDRAFPPANGPFPMHFDSKKIPGATEDGRETLSLSTTLPLVEDISPKGKSIASCARTTLIRSQIETFFARTDEDIALENAPEYMRMPGLSKKDVVESLRDSAICEVVEVEGSTMVRKKVSIVSGK